MEASLDWKPNGHSYSKRQNPGSVVHRTATPPASPMLMDNSWFTFQPSNFSKAEKELIRSKCLKAFIQVMTKWYYFPSPVTNALVFHFVWFSVHINPRPLASAIPALLDIVVTIK